MIHANWVELFWLMIASGGWLAAFINFYEARHDWHRFRDSPIALQRFMTRSIFTAASIIWSKHTTSLVAALWAITHAPPPPENMTYVTQLFGTTIGWCMLSTLMTVQAILNIRWRRQLSTGSYGGGVDPVRQSRRVSDLTPPPDLATERHDELIRHVDLSAEASRGAEKEANTVNQKIASLRKDLVDVARHETSDQKIPHE